MMKKTAYLYNRISTRHQTDGHGLSRQEQSSRDFLKNFADEYEIEESINEIASAFKGHNVTVGKTIDQSGGLEQFIQMAEAKQLKGQAEGLTPLLAIEAPDRLTRMAPRKGQQLFDRLFDAGVDVALVRYGKIIYHDDDDDFGGSILITIGLHLAHQESKQKALRIGNAKDKNQRAALDSGRLFTSGVPAWLNVVGKGDNKKAVLNDDRVLIIKEIFEKYINGWGVAKITNEFNRRNEQNWTRGKQWIQTYIHNIIKGRTVLGEYAPNKVDKNPDSGLKRGVNISLGEVRKDYYPAAINEATWEKARLIRESKPTFRTSKVVAGNNTGTGYNNLFTQGFAVCGNCGRNMNYSDKGNSKTYLICPTHKGKNESCSTINIPYKKFEKIILATTSSHINYDAILNGKMFDGQKAELRIQSNKINDKVNKLKNIIIKGNEAIDMGLVSPTVINRINKAEIDKDELMDELSEINRKLVQMNDSSESSSSIGETIVNLIGYEPVSVPMVMSTKDYREIPNYVYTNMVKDGAMASSQLTQSVNGFDDITDMDKRELLRTKLHRYLRTIFEKIEIKHDGKKNWIVTYYFKACDTKYTFKIPKTTRNSNCTFELESGFLMNLA